MYHMYRCTIFYRRGGGGTMAVAMVERIPKETRDTQIFFLSDNKPILTATAATKKGKKDIIHDNHVFSILKYSRKFDGLDIQYIPEQFKAKDFLLLVDPKCLW